MKTILKTKSLLIILLIIFIHSGAFALPKKSNGNGNWNTAATWIPVGVPTGSDDITIASGTTVTLDINVTIRSINIENNATLTHQSGLTSITLNVPVSISYINNGIHDAGEGAIALYYKFGNMRSGFDGNGIINGDIEIIEGGPEILKTCNVTINGNISSSANPSGTTAFFNYGNVTLNGEFVLNQGGSFDNYGYFNQTIGSTTIYDDVWLQNYGIFKTKGNLNLCNPLNPMSGNNSFSIFRNATDTSIASIGGNVMGDPTIPSLFIQEGGALAQFGGKVFPTGYDGELCTAGRSYFYPRTTEPNTVEYNGITDQFIKIPTNDSVLITIVWGEGPPYNYSPKTYSNLIISNAGTKKLAANTIVNGNLIIRNAAALDASTSNFNITLKGNWTDSSSATDPFVERNGKVSFSDTSTQSIIINTLSGGETFYDLTINNSDSGLVFIHGNVNVSDTLTLTDGLIHTGTDTLWVANADTAFIKGYSDSTYINGYLKRSISASGGNYDFPVGNEHAYELANVHFFGADTISTPTVNFSNPSGGSGLPLTDANEAQYTALLNSGGTIPGTGNANAGVWNIHPGKGKAIYDLSLYGRHYGNAGTQYHSIVKRNNSLSPWVFAGTYLAASGAEPLIAHRTCLTDFNQFAIATSNTPPPLLTIPLNFTSKDSVVCGSKCISFTSKNNFSATNWRWILSGGTFSTLADTALQNPASICFNSDGNYDVKLIASTACQSYPLAKAQYIKVNVSSLPSASIIGANSICSGNSIQLTASGTGNYLWGSGATTAVINPSPIANTTYSVVVSSGLCSDTAMATITVTTTPTMSITTNKSAICSGDSSELTGTGNGAYLWSTGGSANAITVKPALSQSYTLTLSNGTCFDRKEITINVTTQPSVSISGETSICSGKRTSLSATSTISSGNYLWSNGGTGQAINVTPLTNTTYSVVLSSGLCRDSTTVNIAVTTTPTLTISANKTIICSGEVLTMNATGAGNYFWSNGASTNAISEAPSVSKSYTLTLSNGNCSDQKILAITVIPTPTASISGPITVCKGATTNLTASAANTFLWSTGETSSAINVKPLINTGYSVTVSNGNGLCKDTASMRITLITPIPANAGQDITIPIGRDTVLSASNGTAWSWEPKIKINCNTCQSSTTSPFQTTIYTVTVTDINGCLSSDSVTVFVIPCAELYIPKAFSPNNDGQNDFFYLRGTDCIDKIFSFIIFNRWGEKVFETTDIKAGWDGTQTDITNTGNVFIYHLDVLLINGKTINKTGNVTLIR